MHKRSDVFLIMTSFHYFLFLLMFSVHGLSEVTKETYESCDLRATPIQQWSGNQLGGAVTVELAEGSIHYFVDPVLTNCFLGHKAQVCTNLIICFTIHPNKRTV